MIGWKGQPKNKKAMAMMWPACVYRGKVLIPTVISDFPKKREKWRVEKVYTWRDFSGIGLSVSRRLSGDFYKGYGPKMMMAGA
jgi:hypothetical protein